MPVPGHTVGNDEAEVQGIGGVAFVGVEEAAEGQDVGEVGEVSDELEAR